MVPHTYGLEYSGHMKYVDNVAILAALIVKTELVALMLSLVGKFVPLDKVHPLTFKNWRKSGRKMNRHNWSRLLHNRV